MNLSLAGCGFLGIYHVGVASCFREYAPHILVDKIAGASAGALAASALLCNVSLGDSTTDLLSVVVKARSRALGPFHPGFDLNKIIYDGLVKILPADAYIRCSGCLHISCTRVSDGQNVLLSDFRSNAELIQALQCSCFIPFYSGILPPKFRGVAYMDGGMSDNLPILDENTITVSPFSGESDICPQDSFFNFLQINLNNTSIAVSPNNLYRIARILFPPPPEILTMMCQQGFDDALKFLQRNNMISCTRCLAVQSSFLVSEVDITSEMMTPENPSVKNQKKEHEFDGCKECLLRHQMATYNGLPESVVAAIEDACDQLNKGVINWLFRHRPMKLLSMLSLPYVLPIDITIAAFCKLWRMVPKIQKELRNSLWNMIGLAKSFVHKFDKGRHLYSAKFSCQLAITEYNYASEDSLVTYNAKPQSLTPRRVLSRATSRANSRTSSPPPGCGGLGGRISAGSKSRSMEEIRAFVKPQRKSYAGPPSALKHNVSPRRQSMTENTLLSYPSHHISSGPERVISSMNFGFTMDLSEHSSKAAATGSYKDKHQNLMEAFKTLDDDSPNLNMIEMANKAMNWERDFLHRSQPNLLLSHSGNASDTFENILDVTNRQEALMAFYYMDEHNRVKVTEIFNVTDADTSVVLDQEERENNAHLQWDAPDWSEQFLDENSHSDWCSTETEDLNDLDCIPKSFPDKDLSSLSPRRPPLSRPLFVPSASQKRNIMTLRRGDALHENSLDSPLYSSDEEQSNDDLHKASIDQGEVVSLASEEFRKELNQTHKTRKSSFAIAGE